MSHGQAQKICRWIKREQPVKITDTIKAWPNDEKEIQWLIDNGYVDIISCGETKRYVCPRLFDLSNSYSACSKSLEGNDESMGN